MQSNRSLDQGSELFDKEKQNARAWEIYESLSAQGFSLRLFTLVVHGLGVDTRLMVNILLGRSLASNVAKDLSRSMIVFTM